MFVRVGVLVLSVVVMVRVAVLPVGLGFLLDLMTLHLRCWLGLWC